MERRFSPRLACAADRRERRLLSRLRAHADHATSRGSLRSGFAYQGEQSVASQRRNTRRAERHICRRPPSFHSCKITIRSAIARFGERLDALAPPAAIEAALADHAARTDAADAVHGRGMGRNTAVPAFSAIFAARWRTPCAKDGARNFRRPMRRMANARFPIRFRPRPSPTRSHRLGQAETSRTGQAPARLVRRLLECRARYRHAATCQSGRMVRSCRPPRAPCSAQAGIWPGYAAPQGQSRG